MDDSDDIERFRDKVERFMVLDAIVGLLVGFYGVASWATDRIIGG